MNRRSARATAPWLLACILSTPLLCQKENDEEFVTFEQREMRACGPKEKEVNYSAETDKREHPTGEQRPGMALIYVLRSSAWGRAVQAKLAVDREWKGVNHGKNYFFFTVQPGLHYFCSQAENRAVLVMTVEAGKTYYIEQEIRYFPIKPRNELAIIEDADGLKELAALHLSTWKVKQP